LSKSLRPSFHNHSFGGCAETPENSLLHEENTRLKDENARLRVEDEQLRRIFNTATDRFNILNRQVEVLERELDAEKSYRRELEQHNKRGYRGQTSDI
jgi:hypothetical protein